MDIENKDLFPLSVVNDVNGTRRIAREKVLQVMYANFLTGIPVDDIFPHIYNRIFNFGDEARKEIEENKLLKPAEVRELESDIPIKWRQEEVVFMQELVKSIINHKDEVDELLKSVADHWEIHRIAIIDRVIIHIAVNELLYFDDVPVKVSINEALEVGKEYSTDKSNSFLNGVLDTLTVKFRKENKIMKKGKGLKES